MLFDSPIYLLSLSLVVLIYWRLRHQAQNNFLLAFSYFFYGWWDWRFLGLILISTIVDYFCARAISESGSAHRRKVYLAISVAVNLGFLGFFKYFDFFAGSLHDAFLSVGVDIPESTLNILLPPGISFYTFQAIAYIVDVHAGRISATKSLRDYALFISLFPHLIAGPIQRPDHLLPQVQSERRLDWQKFSDGLLLIVTGLFRKCVVADQCAILANAAFSGGLGEPSVLTVLVGAYAFAWQIYGDFSGYSNIARGSAQLLGFHFMVNFRQPYFSNSLQEFWRRWHISLSTWLRDYLYVPLGGNRRGKARTYANLMATMLLGGLWHGANWTFVIWGAIHGVGLAVERALGLDPQNPSSLLATWARRIVVFNIVCLAWVFFRAPSLSGAMQYLAGLGHWHWSPQLGVAIVMLALFSLPLVALDALERNRNEEVLGQNTGNAARVAVAGAFVGMALLFSASSLQTFIYFQF